MQDTTNTTNEDVKNKTQRRGINFELFLCFSSFPLLIESFCLLAFESIIQDTVYSKLIIFLNLLSLKNIFLAMA